MFWAEIWKKYQKFLSENFHCLVVKFSVHLNRHVFVMGWSDSITKTVHHDVFLTCSKVYMFWGKIEFVHYKKNSRRLYGKSWQLSARALIVNFYGARRIFAGISSWCVGLSYGGVAQIPTMSFMLPTLPYMYTALTCIIITVNNLQAPVKLTVHLVAASCQYLP